ncbi:uncharacterized protein RHIMIDRAFT_303884 [Rhizopus microsporus ATCC 52813]|uniref:Uncharacterized protein n=1 Tax=Rhizopus microsporus ATCC 52813 TaxID=1340429 RepID=A0A2G4T195_RHIZD|nr:uncharacterized protein RHIMIDRAFT_303884 [Rhizopus microsporus ATCC 52813]PHZ14446.1 hypothetical protein RHIMIDRAFT_303884 [Rhizopus microsporus ATCC 52813]
MPTYSVNVVMFGRIVLNEHPLLNDVAMVVLHESEITTTKTPSGEQDGLTITPKFQEVILVQDQRSEISAETAPTVYNSSHLQSKFANAESFSQSTQEVDQNYLSSTSRSTSPASATAEVYSDAEMDEVHHSSEHSEKSDEASSSDSEMNEVQNGPKVTVFKSPP